MKAACVALALCVASYSAAAQYRNFSQAAKEYRDGRWSSAYGSFIVLANDGDAEAARIALHMYRNGPLLYNAQWDASEEDLAHWSKLAGVPYRPAEAERVASAAAAKTPPYRPRIVRFIARPQSPKS